MLSLMNSSTSSPDLRRRSSIVVPTLLQPRHFSARNAAVSSAPSPLSFELFTLKFPNQDQAYTSLRDIIPSSSPANSPTACCSAVCGGGGSGHSIAIRNRLVKQAAWAYLQPMSASPSFAGPSLLHRVSAAAATWLARLRRRVAGALDRVLLWLRVRTYR